MTTYSNPRTYAEFDDWPCGSGRMRCRCVFVVRSSARGNRIERTTFRTDGTPNSPKRGTYCTTARVVDGSDGRIYVLERTARAESICVRESDIAHAHYVRAGDAEFAALAALLSEAPL